MKRITREIGDGGVGIIGVAKTNDAGLRLKVSGIRSPPKTGKWLVAGDDGWGRVKAEGGGERTTYDPEPRDTAV